MYIRPPLIVQQRNIFLERKSQLVTYHIVGTEQFSLTTTSAHAKYALKIDKSAIPKILVVPASLPSKRF